MERLFDRTNFEELSRVESGKECSAFQKEVMELLEISFSRDTNLELNAFQFQDPWINLV